MDAGDVKIPPKIAEPSYSLSPGGRRPIVDAMLGIPAPLERTRGPAGPPKGDRTDTGRRSACCCCPAELKDEHDAEDGAGDDVERVSEGVRFTAVSGCG